MSNNKNCQCDQAHGACKTAFQYAVKFVCGITDLNSPVAPGRYWTAINIHNPDKCRDAHFRWKVVVAAPLGQTPRVPVFQRPVTLGPDLALEIDCQHVRATFPPPVPQFIKGYVVLESDVELDVVAVYTGTQGSSTRLGSLHTERVEARCVPVCEDLILPLHTGLANWQVVAPTPGPLGPVATVDPFWTPPLPGTVWVSQSSSDGTAPPGLRYFELCFNLCAGFTVPSPLSFQIRADDAANIFLNNQLIGNVPPLLTVPINSSLLRAGRNCLRVVVNNSIGSTGFSLAGILRITGGKCPCDSIPIATTVPGPTLISDQCGGFVDNVVDRPGTGEDATIASEQAMEGTDPRGKDETDIQRTGGVAIQGAEDADPNPPG